MISDEAKDIASLVDTEKFIEEYSRQKKVNKTNEQAYNAVEAKYRRLFGATKYSSFKSFERVWYRKLKKAKERRKSNIKELKQRTGGY